MTQDKLQALLGRPLTPIEVANLALYLDIAMEALELLICTPIAPVTEIRTFDLREGYSTAFVDIFTAVTQVKIDDEVIDSSKYSVRQWNKRTASWYNSLVFTDKFKSQNKVIEVTATWGFTTTPYNVPVGLQTLIAGLFAQISKTNKTDSSVQSKRVEDFHITFNTDNDLDTEFHNKYGAFISQYSLCNIGNLRQEKGC